jgi:hypothetical protein
MGWNVTIFLPDQEQAINICVARANAGVIVAPAFFDWQLLLSH